MLGCRNSAKRPAARTKSKLTVGLSLRTYQASLRGETCLISTAVSARRRLPEGGRSICATTENPPKSPTWVFCLTPREGWVFDSWSASQSPFRQLECVAIAVSTAGVRRSRRFDSWSASQSPFRQLECVAVAVSTAGVRRRRSRRFGSWRASQSPFRQLECVAVAVSTAGVRKSLLFRQAGGNECLR